MGEMTHDVELADFGESKLGAQHVGVEVVDFRHVQRGQWCAGVPGRDSSASSGSGCRPGRGASVGSSTTSASASTSCVDLGAGVVLGERQQE